MSREYGLSALGSSFHSTFKALSYHEPILATRHTKFSSQSASTQNLIKVGTYERFPAEQALTDGTNTDKPKALLPRIYL